MFKSCNVFGCQILKSGVCHILSHSVPFVVQLRRKVGRPTSRTWLALRGPSPSWPPSPFGPPERSLWEVTRRPISEGSMKNQCLWLNNTIYTGWWCNNHLEKYEFVNGKDYPRYYGKWKMFETTNQYMYIYIYINTVDISDIKISGGCLMWDNSWLFVASFSPKGWSSSFSSMAKQHRLMAIKLRVASSKSIPWLSNHSMQPQTKVDCGMSLIPS